MTSPTTPLDATTNRPSLTRNVASSSRSTSSSERHEASSSRAPLAYLDPPSLTGLPASTTSNAGSTTTNRSNPGENSLQNTLSHGNDLPERAQALIDRFAMAHNESETHHAGACSNWLDASSRRLVNALNAAYPPGQGTDVGMPERRAVPDVRAARAAATRARADRLRIRIDGSEYELHDAMVTLIKDSAKYQQATEEWEDYNDNEIGGLERMLKAADAKAVFGETRREVRTQTRVLENLRRDLRCVLQDIPEGF